MLYVLVIRNERQRQEYLKKCFKWQINMAHLGNNSPGVQSIHPIRIREFDSEPYVFNCSNGTLHLDTMEFTSLMILRTASQKSLR